MSHIRKAVIPVAGLGTRFLPATKAIPKEMIPIIDRPMIQYIVEEAVQSGIEDIIFVTGRHKEAIENHFDFNYEIEKTLELRGKTELSRQSKDSANLCRVISVRQKEPLGLGHAVGCAASVIGDEPFAVLLGDDLIDASTPCVKQLIDVFEKNKKSVVGVMEVPRSETDKYGIVGGEMLGPKLMKVAELVEKPSPESAPSCLAIPGRYILTPEVFKWIAETKPGKGGEIQLTDALSSLAKSEGLLAYQFDGLRFDTGDRVGYLDATIHFALKREDLKNSTRAMIERYHRMGIG